MTLHAEKRSVMPDIVISCAVLFVSAGALALSFTFSSAVSVLLPRLAASLGIFCALWMIAKSFIESARHRRDREEDREEDPSPTDDFRGTHEETLSPDVPAVVQEIDENDPEYVLSHTPRKVWLVTLGFIAGFFILLYLCGLFIAAAALSLTYLMVVGKRSSTFAISYTVVLTALLWVLMRWVTYISTPAGILLHGG
ncbi:MAG TPA: hypothetical protein VGO88_10350 [Mycetocola sp.]|jgi:small-conductance mechanosensitive channel|nr:hypothetical protein [Mycetocola sp.]